LKNLVKSTPTLTNEGFDALCGRNSPSVVIALPQLQPLGDKDCPAHLSPERRNLLDDAVRRHYYTQGIRGGKTWFEEK